MTEPLSPDPVINLVYQSFARNLSMALSAHLRYDVGIAVEPTSAAPPPPTNPACLAVFRIEPGHLPIVVDFPLPFAKLIIELILGGQPGGSSDEEVSGLTEIETHLLREVLDIIAVELSASMARLGNLHVRTERVETEVEMLRAFSPGDRIVHVCLRASAGDDLFLLRIQQPALSNQNETLPVQPDSALQDAGFLGLLTMVEVDFEARLYGPQLALRELMSLEPGDVIRLRHQTSQPLAGFVNGQDQFKGHIVTAARRRAFLVEP